MAHSSNWLNLHDLGEAYGISAINCGRVLQKHGWRDQQGHPTTRALQAGAAQEYEHNNSSCVALWNSEVCKGLLEQKNGHTINRTNQIDLWAKLLEALEEGSPSIVTTPAQMAEELPKDLIYEVNQKLALRGCTFRASQEINKVTIHT